MEYGLRRVAYTDYEGRKKIVLLPEGVPENQAERGIPVGPPSLQELNLPIETEVRLNNELFHRGILTLKDARKNTNEIIYALQAALKVDAANILDLYVGKDNHHGGSKHPEEQPNQALADRRQSRARART